MFFFFLSSLLLLALPYTTANGDNNPSSSCRLYLAPSHLATEQNAMVGLFAGNIDWKENETLPWTEIAIPLVDFIEGPYRSDNLETMQYLEGFMWGGEYAGAKWEGNFSTTILVPGFGTLAHYHSGISNIDWVHGAVLLRDNDNGVFQPGQAHPSRGAVSPYYNLTMKASTNIKAGMELFANFGNVWDKMTTKDNEATEDIYEERITRKDYMDADKVLDRILKFMDEYGDQMETKKNKGKGDSNELKEETLDFILDQILMTAGGNRAKAIRSLIPDNPKKLQKVKDMGGTFNYRNQDLVKRLDWLERDGVCVDTLTSGPSTIPDAGRGAFATRDIKEGDRISLVPMIVITDDDLMRMYEIYETKDEDDDDDDDEFENDDEDEKDKTFIVYDTEKPIGQQLILNYAFGHSQSSILLIPTAPMVSYINHASKDKANAYIDWSNHEKMYMPNDLQEMSIDELKDIENPNVVMQVVASRDIKKGEEVFIDYGDDWAEEWKAYKENFNAEHADGKWPLQAADLRAQYKNQPYTVDLRVGHNPYPQGVVTSCFIEADNVPDGRARWDDKDQEIMIWKGPKTFDEYIGGNLVVCDLISREVDATHGFVYNVSARLKDADSVVQVEGVPHAAITLTDRPYQGDIHTPGAFRRWISIEDERFPQAWRNLRP